MNAIQRLTASPPVFSDLRTLGAVITARKTTARTMMIKDMDDVPDLFESHEDFTYSKKFADVLGLGQELHDLAAFFRIYDFRRSKAPDEFTNGDYLAKVKPGATSILVVFYARESE